MRAFELPSRRRVLRTLSLAGAGAALSGCGVEPVTVRSGPSALDDLASSSATSLAAGIARKDFSSVELVEAHLRRIEEVNPILNAVVQTTARDALEHARRADAAVASGEALGPLHGVPMTIKDSFDTKGVLSTAGTKGRQGFVPEADATVVSRLKSAGAILLGKTNTPELTFAGQTDNLVYGRTNNPYDPRRSPGGSSGGAAAIVAAFGSPFDIGSDTGGSIRAPAHFAGVTGLKPTSGRVPRTGHIVGFDDVLESLTTVGPIARTVEDLELLLNIISGVDGKDPAIAPVGPVNSAAVDVEGLRVAYYTDNTHVPADADTQASVYAAAKALGDRGCLVREDRPAPIPRTDAVMFSLFADGGAGIERRLARAGTDEPHPWLAPFLDPTAAVSAAEAYERIEAWASYRREMLAFMGGYDAIVCPVTAHPAPQHLAPSESIDYASWYTEAFNLTGWPATVVRCGTSVDGLPIGIQIAAAPWREDVSLALARTLEEDLGGYQPPFALIRRERTTLE